MTTATAVRQRSGSVVVPPALVPPRRARAGWRFGAAWLWSALLAAAAVQTWFRPGRFFASGDVAPFVRNGIEPEFGWLWNHQFTGAGSHSYAIARAMEVWTLRVVEALGGSATLAQRLFYTVLVMFAVGAVAWFASTLVRSRAAVAIAGIVAFLHPFWTTRLPNPLVILFLGYLAFVGGVLVRAARDRPIRATSFALATVGCSFLALNPPLLVVLAAWATCVVLAGSLVGGPGGFRRVAGFTLRAAPWVLLLNVWWLVPWVMTLAKPVGFEFSAQTSVLAWSWTHVNNSVSNLVRLIAHWAWGRPEYIPVSLSYEQGPLDGALWVLPILVFAAPFVIRGKTRRLAWVFLGFVCALVFLSKGLHGPLSSVNATLYRVVPGFFVLREPFSKLGPLVLVLYVTMLALLIDSLVARRMPARRKAPWLVLALIAAVLLIAQGFPMWTGRVVATERPVFPSARVELPTWWHSAANAINDDPSDGKLLTLPLSDYYQLPTRWGYYGVDHTRFMVKRPVVQRLPGGYFSDTPAVTALMTAVEKAILTGDEAAVPRLLRSLGVDLVLVRGDLDLGMVGGRDLASPRVLADALRSLPGVSAAGRFGPLSLYRVNDSMGSVDGYRDAVLVDDNPAHIAAVTGSVSPDVAVVTDRGTVEPSILGSLSHGRAGVMIRPPSGDGYPLGSQRRSLAIRPQGARVARASVEDDDLVFRDAWSADDGRRPVLASAEIGRIHLSGKKPRAISVDGVAVHLGARGALLQLPAEASTVTILGDTRKSVTAGGPSTVGDCDAKDDYLAPDELGLRAVDLPNGVRLISRAHQACVSWRLSGIRAGAWLRVHIEHRSIRGLPARVCLLDTRSQRCIPLAALSSDARWTPYNGVVRVPPDAGRLRLYAYADGPRLADNSLASKPSVTEYRKVAVQRLTPIATGRLDATRVAPTVDVKGPGRVVVRGPVSGNVLGRWVALGDCNRYDDRSADEAGLRSRPIAGGVELAASAHSACVSAPIEHLNASSVLNISFRYRAIHGARFARVCVYDPAARNCLALEPADGSPLTRGASLPTSGAWRTFRGWARVPPNAMALRLYVYADGAPSGVQGPETRIQYADLSVEPVAPFAFVVADGSVLDDNVSAREPVPTDWHGPAAFTAQIAVLRGSRSIIASHESAASGWHLNSHEGIARPVAVHGYRSGWVLSGADLQVESVDVSYSPAVLARRAINVSQAAAVVAVILISWSIWGRIRRRSQRSERGAATSRSDGAKHGALRGITHGTVIVTLLAIVWLITFAKDA